MKFFKFLKKAFSALKKNPRLFAPKFFVAAVYGAMLVLFAFFLRGFEPVILDSVSGGLSAESIALVRENLLFFLLLPAVALFSLVLDIFVNAMYPPMLKEHWKGKKVSLKKAFSHALSRFFTVAASFFIVLFLLFAALSIAAIFAGSFIPRHTAVVTVALTIVVSLVFAFAFYYAYPVLVLEKVSVFSGLKKSISLAKKNKALTLKASLFPLAISLFDLYLAFDIFNPLNFLLFSFTRALIAITATYHMALEPTIYLGLGEAK